MRVLGLALALVVTACLTAVASQDTNAYFSDSKSGTMTGTLGTWGSQAPYRIEAGASKARHWDSKGCRPARVLPIAQYDSSGALFLDFGDEVRHNSNASPDVFRLISLVDQSQAVTFKVTGPMSTFVSVVRLGDGKSGVLKGRATASVYIKICVPEHARTGTYTGTLTVHVDGWAADAQLPMTITVRSTEPRYRARPARTRQLPRARATSSTVKSSTASPTPTVTPTPTASPTPTPTASPTPTAAATPEAPTPTATPETSPTPATRSGAVGG
jgi:cell division septation protein DedD